MMGEDYRIRRAEPGDIPELAALADILHGALEISPALPFDIESVNRSFAALLESPSGIVLLLEHRGEMVGAVGGRVEPCLWNLNIRVAHQLGIYVLPVFRGTQSIRLHRAFVDECRRMGAIGIYLMSPPELGKVWARMGYSSPESIYFKEV